MVLFSQSQTTCLCITTASMEGVQNDSIQMEALLLVILRWYQPIWPRTVRTTVRKINCLYFSRNLWFCLLSENCFTSCAASFVHIQRTINHFRMFHFGFDCCEFILLLNFLFYMFSVSSVNYFWCFWNFFNSNFILQAFILLYQWLLLALKVSYF